MFWPLAGLLGMWYTAGAPKVQARMAAIVGSRTRAASVVVGLLLLGAAGQGAALSPLRAASALARAQARADKGQTDQAIELLQSVLHTNPDYVEAHMLYIRLRSLAARAVVQREYEQKLKAEPDNALLYFLVGYAMQDPAAKCQRYRKAVELDPDLYVAQVELGRVCRAEAVNDLSGSRVALETAASLRPDAPEAHLELARTLALSGKRPEAIAAYRRVIELDPRSEAAWYGLACLLSRDEPAGSERTLAEAVRHCPSSGLLWWHLGDLRWARGAWDEAAPCLQKALGLAPNGPYAPEAGERLAAYHLSRGRHRSARRLGATPWSEAASEMAEGRLGAEAFRALYAAGAPGTEGRLEHLKRAEGLAPESLVVQRHLADEFLAAGSFGPAAAALARVLAAHPTDAALRLRCAEAQLLAGRPADALATLGADRRHIAGETAWFVADAEALAAQGVPLEAIAARYAARRARRPDRQEYHRLLRACVERFPGYLTARLELAASLGEAGDTAGARAALEAAAPLRGHPLAEAEAQAQLGELALAEGAYEKAAGHFKVAVESCPENARLHGALARAAVGAGNFATALEALTRQLALDPASYNTPASPSAGKGPGHRLLPRLEPGDVLRYRYSTDGGQPRRALAWVDFDYVVEVVRPGHVVEGTIEVAGVGGRQVEGGKGFVGARCYVLCTSCFGLLAADRPARGVPREFATILWLVGLLHGPALPAPRWPGQAWRPAPMAAGKARPASPTVASVTFERVSGGKAYLSVELRDEQPRASPAMGTRDPAAAHGHATMSGRAAVVFGLAEQVVERVQLILQGASSDGRGAHAEGPPWLHRLELLRIDRGARKTAPARGS